MYCKYACMTFIIPYSVATYLYFLLNNYQLKKQIARKEVIYIFKTHSIILSFPNSINGYKGNS